MRRPRHHRLFVIVFALSLGVAAIACGGGGSGGTTTPTEPSPPASNLNIAGTWTGSAYDAAGNFSGPGAMTWQITQTGAAFSGTMTITDSGTNVTGRGTVSGTVSGSSLTFSMSVPSGGFDSPYAACTANVTGSGVAAASSINGNYTGTSSCSGAISSGQITLNKQ
jgi:hypothetical protein